MKRFNPEEILEELLSLPSETEWVEFKEAKNNYKFEKLGEYFSALSNESNLKGREFGWLVFGVKDEMPRRIVGTRYKENPQALSRLKNDIANHTNNRLTFEEIYEIDKPTGRVLMFQIPPALRGAPTSWKGHYYGREGQSIGPLNMREIDQITTQVKHEDWSAEICPGATLEDLDSDAIEFAKEQYKEKHPDKAKEVDDWSDIVFLNKAKTCIRGKITNTAVVLLGKSEAEHLLNPAHAKITWVLRDEKGMERDYQHWNRLLFSRLIRS